MIPIAKAEAIFLMHSIFCIAVEGEGRRVGHKKLWGVLTGTTGAIGTQCVLKNILSQFWWVALLIIKLKNLLFSRFNFQKLIVFILVPVIWDAMPQGRSPIKKNVNLRALPKLAKKKKPIWATWSSFSDIKNNVLCVIRKK